MSAAKNWTFTINNYTGHDEVKIDTMFDHGHMNYVVYGREVGANGTPHLQGYVQFKKKLRLTQVKQMISARGHFEVARGSPEINRRYCMIMNEDITEQVQKIMIFMKRDLLYIEEVIT